MLSCLLQDLFLLLCITLCSESKIITPTHFLFSFSTLLGRDAAFIGPNENQFAILDDDKTGLALYTLPGMASQEIDEKNEPVEQNQSADTKVGSIRGPMQFMFETEVDRIFSTPLGA